MAMVACAALSMAMVTGCNKDSVTAGTTAGTKGSSETTTAATTQAATEDTKAQNTKLSGTISLSGSTSMQKLADALAESFMEANGGVTVTVEYTGSSAGIEALLNGSCDIGDSSRNLKDSEKESGAVENIVAIDGIAVVVDKNNTVASLTKDQLVSIYTGAVTNWSELGGSDTPIVVVGREAGSGTRGAFEEILKVVDSCKYAVECDNTGAAMAKVASTEGAIGYVSLDVVDDSVRALALEGVEANAENIVAGTYFLCRPFVMATKGEISQQNDIVKAWFDYVASDEGKEITKKVGLIIPQ